MAARKRRRQRDVEKGVSRRAFANKLRRLADALEGGDRYRIQIAGERISVPPDAEITLEHEREEGSEEVEFQLRWRL
ncbi:MAG: amphi-Trp domain-containing protein [Myxococcota bacterium]